MPSGKTVKKGSMRDTAKKNLKRQNAKTSKSTKAK